jgi:hypothetical protein
MTMKKHPTASMRKTTMTMMSDLPFTELPLFLFGALMPRGRRIPSYLGILSWLVKP